MCIRDRYWLDALRLPLCFGPVCVLVYFQEKHNRENFLRMLNVVDEEKRWRSILYHLPDGIAAFDQKQNLSYYNHTVSLICGSPQEEQNRNDQTLLKFAEIKCLKKDSNNHPLGEFVSPSHFVPLVDDSAVDLSDHAGGNAPNSASNDFPLIQVIRDFVFREAQSVNSDSSIKPKSLKFETQIHVDHTLRDYEILLIFNPADARTVAVFTDVTQRNMNIRLCEVSEYKSRIIRSMSHDTIALLQDSIGLLESSNFTKEEKHEIIRPVIDCSNYVICMINDILRLCKGNAEALSLTPSDCKLEVLLEETVGLLRWAANRKNIELKVHISSDVPVRIRTDSNRLKQVLLNLLSNAVKFTYSGGIELRVELIDHNNSIKFSVVDTGIGIERKYFSNLLRRLGKIRQNGSEHLGYSGAGLGLEISNLLVNMLEGPASRGISFESEYQKGSSFWFTLLSNPPAKINSGAVGDGRLVDSQDHIQEEFKNDDLMSLQHQDELLHLKRDVDPDRENKRNGVELRDITVHEKHNCQDILLVDDIVIPLTVDYKPSRRSSRSQRSGKVVNYAIGPIALF
eukprot:TRINITY_DN9711_c0_g2_i6.p1 TRINITY_DN9711_c0_g2~~TRINITY_DN9711_c0_g2_i6.p1  ORF type:complete len:569 (+),score=31.39 TRINITY_DN9711_c0_g2_i6:79-1785(+)